MELYRVNCSCNNPTLVPDNYDAFKKENPNYTSPLLEGLGAYRCNFCDDYICCFKQRKIFFTCHSSGKLFYLKDIKSMRGDYRKMRIMCENCQERNTRLLQENKTDGDSFEENKTAVMNSPLYLYLSTKVKMNQYEQQLLHLLNYRINSFFELQKMEKANYLKFQNSTVCHIQQLLPVSIDESRSGYSCSICCQAQCYECCTKNDFTCCRNKIQQ